VVLTAVELLAAAGSGEVVVVDVGGATTDVHSVVEPDPEDAGLSREVVATLPVSRTVEGDLGMRWSAVSTVAEGLTAGLLPDTEELRAAATLRREHPGFLPADDRESHDDELLATAAVGVALRRHAGRRQVGYDGGARVVRRSGKDLRRVAVLVGSGGVLRAAAPGTALRVLASGTGVDVPGGWQLPQDPHLVVDVDYLMAPAGLLARRHPRAARALVRRLLAAGAAPPPSLGA